MHVKVMMLYGRGLEWHYGKLIGIKQEALPRSLIFSSWYWVDCRTCGQKHLTVRSSIRSSDPGRVFLDKLRKSFDRRRLNKIKKFC